MYLAKPLHIKQEQSSPEGQEERYRELLQLVASRGDREAFEILFRHFGPKIKAIMQNSGADSAMADDIVQDAMLIIWRKASYYNPSRGSVSSWVFTIARNLRIDRLRHSSSRPYQDIEEIELRSFEPDAEDQLAGLQRARHVETAVAELPDEQRQIIELAFVQDISQREMAKTLDIPVGTVKSRMRLAYGKLKVLLEDLR